MSSSIGFNLSNAVVPEIRKANNTFNNTYVYSEGGVDLY